MQHQLLLPPSTGQHVLQLNTALYISCSDRRGRSTTLQFTGVCEWNNVAQTYCQTSTGPRAVCLIFRSDFFKYLYFPPHILENLVFSKQNIINKYRKYLNSKNYEH